MKVICIDDKKRRKDVFKRPGNWHIKEGEIYTVLFKVKAYTPNYAYIDAFVLLEDPLNNEFGWEESRFIPLSDIDETELVNQREEECIS